MNQHGTTSAPQSPLAPVAMPLDTIEIDRSFRAFLLTAFICSAAWLLGVRCSRCSHRSSSTDLIFWRILPWLTYGRIRPAHIHCWLYGFALPTGLTLGLWMFGRLGKTQLAYPVFALTGVVFYNLGVLIGVLGVLAGDATGYEFFEFPAYAAVILFLGYLLIGWCSVATLHQRSEPDLYVSQWFILAAVFWFPWIFTTAWLLLLVFPVRGVAQSAVAWWYAENLQVVWLWLSGLATVHYLVPKLTGRALHSRYLALLMFWLLLLFGSWGGIPRTAPLPSWLPVLSTVAVVLGTLVPLLVFLNLHGTLEGRWRRLWDDPVRRFVGVGVAVFFLVSLMRLADAVPTVGRVVDFTWFTYAKTQLNLYGFFAMVTFAGAYFVLARLPEVRLSAKLVRIHFWLAFGGIILGLLPLVVGGIIEGFKVRNPEIAFMDAAAATLHFLRVSTIGDLLLLSGHALFLWNLVASARCLCQERFVMARAAATQELYATTEVTR
jgi:cytochrome c oxidase cbb3-type subunit I